MTVSSSPLEILRFRPATPALLHGSAVQKTHERLFPPAFSLSPSDHYSACYRCKIVEKADINGQLRPYLARAQFVHKRRPPRALHLPGSETRGWERRTRDKAEPRRTINPSVCSTSLNADQRQNGSAVSPSTRTLAQAQHGAQPRRATVCQDRRTQPQRGDHLGPRARSSDRRQSAGIIVFHVPMHLFGWCACILVAGGARHSSHSSGDLLWGRVGEDQCPSSHGSSSA